MNTCRCIRLRKYFLLCICVLNFSLAYSQYSGGGYNGFSSITLTCPAFNVYTGGPEVGSGVVAITCPVTVNIFSGGSFQGFDFDKIVCSVTIFSGGSGDGFSFSGISCGGLFKGGTNDGFAFTSNACSASANVYAGGSSDGFSSGSIACAASVSIFNGGSNDGFALFSFTCPSPANIFSGGPFNGFAGVNANCPAPVNVFTGGPYDGFAANNIACASPINVFSGGGFDGFGLSTIGCAATVFSGGASDGFSFSSISCSGMFTGGGYDGFAMNSMLCTNVTNVFAGGDNSGFGINTMACSVPGNIFVGDWSDGFSYATNGCGIGLPVELTSFNVTCSKMTVTIAWKIESQINNDYFTVERAVDGMNFQSVGMVTGAGTSSVPTNYTYVDVTPLEGLSYYRLKQTDYNGHYHYFNTITTACEDLLSSFYVYPNPNNGHFTIESAEQPAEVLITNLFGEKILRTKINNSKTEIVLNNQVQGIYFVRLNFEKRSITKKIVINQ